MFVKTQPQPTGSNKEQILRSLADFVRIPSVSADPAFRSDVRRCAEWLTEYLRGLGTEQVHLIETRGHPVVFAQSPTVRNAPTVLIYGHYDVQPARSEDGWISSPFKPVIRGEYLYGRGSSDDKGQIFSHITAVRLMRKNLGRLPLNVCFLLEGEEEIGSPNLGGVLQRVRRYVNPDVVVISDTAMRGKNRPAITHALRGTLNMGLQVWVDRPEVHSGLFGGAVPDPAMVLSRILASLQSCSASQSTAGRSEPVAIEGFYNSVRKWDSEELAYMRKWGPGDREIFAAAGGDPVTGNTAHSLYERTTILPSLTISGITAGYQGAGTKGIVPARASAKINIRLVPDQDPGRIMHLVRRHVDRYAPPGVRVRISRQYSARPFLISRSHPMMRIAAKAYEDGFGVPPVFLRSGGSIPAAVLFQDIFRVPVVLMGFGLPDDGQHGPNEKLQLPTFFKSIQTSIRFLQRMAARSRPAPSTTHHTNLTGIPV